MRADVLAVLVILAAGYLLAALLDRASERRAAQGRARRRHQAASAGLAPAGRLLLPVASPEPAPWPPIGADRALGDLLAELAADDLIPEMTDAAIRRGLGMTS